MERGGSEQRNGSRQGQTTDGACIETRLIAVCTDELRHDPRNDVDSSDDRRTMRLSHTGKHLLGEFLHRKDESADVI